MKQVIIDLYNEWYYHTIAGCDTSYSDLAELAKIATELKVILEGMSDDDSPDRKYQKYSQTRALLTSLQIKRANFANKRYPNEKRIISKKSDWLKPTDLTLFKYEFSKEFTKLILARSFINTNDSESKFYDQIKAACTYVQSSGRYEVQYYWHMYKQITKRDDEKLLKLFLTHVPLKGYTYIDLLKLSINNNLFRNYELVANYILMNYLEIDLIPNSLKICFDRYYFPKHSLETTQQAIQFLLTHGLDINKEYIDWEPYGNKTKKLSPYMMAQRVNADKSILDLLIPKHDHTSEQDKDADNTTKDLNANSSVTPKQKASSEDDKAQEFDLVKAALIQGGYIEKCQKVTSSENNENHSEQKHSNIEPTNSKQENSLNKIEKIFQVALPFLKGYYADSTAYPKKLPKELIIEVLLFKLHADLAYTTKRTRVCLNMLTMYLEDLACNNTSELQALTIDNIFIYFARYANLCLDVTAYYQGSNVYTFESLQQHYVDLMCENIFYNLRRFHVPELEKIAKVLVENTRHNKINNKSKALETKLIKMLDLVPLSDQAGQMDISEYAVRTNNQSLIIHLQDNGLFYLPHSFLHEMVCSIDFINTYSIDTIKQFVDNYNTHTEHDMPGITQEKAYIRYTFLISPRRVLELLISKLASLTVDDLDIILKCYYQIFPTDNELSYCRTLTRPSSHLRYLYRLIKVLIEKFYNQPYPSVLRLMSKVVNQIEPRVLFDSVNHPLKLAIKYDFPEAVSIILSAYKEPAKSTYYAICEAGKQGKIKIFQHLLATFDRLDKSDQGIDILFSCLNIMMLRYMKDLYLELEDKGFTPSLKNKNGDTPLTYAIKNGDYLIVHWLISTYPESLHGIQGVNALTIAVAAKQAAIVALLLDKGVSPHTHDDNDNSAFKVVNSLNHSEQSDRIHRILANHYKLAKPSSKSLYRPGPLDNKDPDQGPSSDKAQDDSDNESQLYSDSGGKQTPQSFFHHNCNPSRKCTPTLGSNVKSAESNDAVKKTL